MKKYVILILMLCSIRSVHADVIVKSSSALSGYISQIPELDLYLFEKFENKNNAEYVEENSNIYLCGTAGQYYDQEYKDHLNIIEVSKKYNIKIAVIDTGALKEHEDLNVTGENDLLGHGTAICGIIGAVKNNGKGISGLCDAEIKAYNIFGRNKISDNFSLIRAIVQASSEDMNIISIHSGTEVYSKALKEAVEYACNKEIIIIAAGGNTNSGKVLYPAAFENVISVGSVNYNNIPCTEYDWGYDENNCALGSCYGENVDLAVKAVDFFSADINNSYSVFKGTSFSAAVVTGLAGYLLESDNSLNLHQLKEKLHYILSSKVRVNDHIEKNNIAVYTTEIEKIIDEKSEKNSEFSKSAIVSELDFKCLSFNSRFSRRRGHSSVVFKDKIWVIGGYEGSKYLNDIWVSENGKNWEKIKTEKIFSERTEHSCVVYNDKLWIIGGTAGKKMNDVWCSSDGKNWTEVSSNSAFTKRNGHCTVAFKNKIWIIAGKDDFGALNDVWYSEDGQKWIEMPLAEFDRRYYHRSIVFKDKLYVIGGVGKKDVWCSENGINWKLVNDDAEFNVRASHSLNVFKDKLFLVSGYSLNRTSDIWCSTDGIVWKKQANAKFSERNLHSSVVLNDTLFIIGGFNGSVSLNDVWYADL